MCFEPVVKIGWMAFLTMEDAPLCGRCEKDLEKITGPLCNDCGRMMEEPSICEDCQKWRRIPFWTDKMMKNRSVYIYNEGMKEILNQFKFRGDVELVKVFRHELSRLYRKEYSKVDLICPIPLSDERLYERGFNQTQLLAELLGKKVTPLMTKKHEIKQSKKSRKERIESNTTFEVLPQINVYGKHILLVDDLYTTGSTIRNAAKVLLEHGASQISSLTVIRS